ncbi:hypothetical protein BKA70DRAFT_1482486 [Coprinopsis sp. MPI-PUGE-AT-0042]|nr:hypothetical protein BKA70DRAFT_1482486 [Coprinopsis sp. MPI-PUGE-AT-0042]
MIAFQTAAFLSTPPASAQQATCSQIYTHKEWSVILRSTIFVSVKCLMTLPPRENREGVTSRYEEFQATPYFTSLNGHFLPWHRHLNTLYAAALREECSYKGPFAFWDWSRDADSTQPVAGTYKLPPDPKNESFAGVGRYKGCVMDGPFKDVKIHRGPGKMITTHCIVRGIDEMWRRGVQTNNVQRVLDMSTTYEKFRLTIDDIMYGHIHGSGHGIILCSTFIHGNLDRIWWKWQNVDPATRTYEISGPSTQGGKDQITLDFVMDFPALGPNITAREVMDAKAYPGCFTYDY